MSIFTRLDRFRWAKIRPTAYLSLPNNDSDKDSEDGLLGKENVHYHSDQKRDRMSQTVPFWRNPRFITAHIVLFSLYLIVLVGIVRQRPRGVRVFGTFPNCEFLISLSQSQLVYTLQCASIDLLCGC